MMRSYGVERAFGVSSLVIGIIAVFLRIYSLINDKILAICIILTVFGVYLMVKESSQFE
jgi:type IV secretory pathway VirB3-like protein